MTLGHNFIEEESMEKRHVKKYLAEVKAIVDKINVADIEKMIDVIVKIRDKRGRLFFLGVGGGAANASHAVNDFRKIAGIESYAPTDNVSELTARINDEGWDTVFVNWLKGNRVNCDDGIFVFSVGGGSVEKNISRNIVNALEYSKKVKAKILGVVGRDGGYTAKVADACVVVPTVNRDTITPHTESFQSMIWHLLISHPAVKAHEMKWESLK